MERSTTEPVRKDATVDVRLTERELRSLVRGTCLVIDFLRPECGERWRAEPPTLAVARSVLVAAAERAGIDLDVLVSP